MKDSNFYKGQIVELVQNIDDVVFLHRLYKLIRIIIKIDDDWMLRQFDKFIDNIQK